jgi:pilus assembly protein Flp/PilA
LVLAGRGNPAGIRLIRGWSFNFNNGRIEHAQPDQEPGFVPEEEDGPTAVEYAVMLALIIVVCIAAITTLGSNANETFSFVGSSIKP